MLGDTAKDLKIRHTVERQYGIKEGKQSVQT